MKDLILRKYLVKWNENEPSLPVCLVEEYDNEDLEKVFRRVALLIAMKRTYPNLAYDTIISYEPGGELVDQDFVDFYNNGVSVWDIKDLIQFVRRDQMSKFHPARG